MSTAQTYEFKTEARQLLDLMIHSVYSHREIFLRELISNASDALDKLRFEALTKDALRGLTEDLHIRIEPDKEKNTLTIHDTGVGMNRDELVEYLGTIARSGTKEFLRLAQEAKDKALPPELIGQFGVGFYSSFMVADRVTVVSRKAGEEKAWRWESTGDGTYSIDEASRDHQGTSVTLHLKVENKDEKAGEDDEHHEVQDFATEWTIRDIVRKYSDFVAYPIRMRVERHKRVGEGKDAKDETTIEDATLNSMKAIWMRPEKEITEDEHKEFYKHLSRDWNDPLKWVMFKAEGTTNEFRSLLYIPTKAGHDLYMPEAERGVNLYIKRVFIMHDCKDLVPEYLRFVRGVVDAEDLPLNISREILQHDRRITGIRKTITRKVLDAFKAMRTDQRDKFLEFWKEFGRVVKEGLFKVPEDRDRLFDACLFQSTFSPSDWFTMEEYVGRMKPEQKSIYYLTGETRAMAESSPHLEAFRAKGYEVLLLSDPVDEVWVQFVHEYKGKTFQSAAKGVAELGSEEERKKEEETRKEKETAWKPLLETLQGKLSEHVKEVRLSSRLTTSPACIVGNEYDMTPQLEALLKATGKDVPSVKRILELNATHPLLEKLNGIYATDKNDSRIADYAELLYGQALLAEGGKLPDPAGFSRRVAELMVKALS